MVFEPGQGGRPKGAKGKNELRDAFMKVFCDLQVVDQKARYNLRVWAENNPSEFYSIISKMLPKDITIDGEIKARVMQLLVDKSDVPEGSLTFGEGVKDEGKAPPVSD